MIIKYLDPIVIPDKFQTVEQIKAVVPRAVEAVGYLVKEDADGYFIAATKNGPAFNHILYIPFKSVVGTPDKSNATEIKYHEVQGIHKQATIDKLGEPPVVELCGFIAFEDHDVIWLAQERNVDGKYRTITAVPKSALI